MGIGTAPGLTAEEIVRPSREHTFFSGRIKGAATPIAIDHAEGVYLYRRDGRRLVHSTRHFTGRYKVLARYRSYHGATMGAMTLTGDPRRWPNEPGLVGVVRYPDTHRWGEKDPRPVEESLRGLEDVIRYEGPHTIAAIF